MSSVFIITNNSSLSDYLMLDWRHFVCISDSQCTQGQLFYFQVFQKGKSCQARNLQKTLHALPELHTKQKLPLRLTVP